MRYFETGRKCTNGKDYYERGEGKKRNEMKNMRKVGKNGSKAL